MAPILDYKTTLAIVVDDDDRVVGGGVRTTATTCSNGMTRGAISLPRAPD